MKTVSPALAAAHAAAVQRPAHLVEAYLDSGVQRWSTRGTVSWGGHTWQARAMRVDDLLVLPLRVQGTLVLANEDDAIGTLVLAQGVQDRRFVIYGYDAAATALGDVVWLADAVGGACEVSAREVRISLRHRAEFVQSPRTYVNAAAGFQHLLPAGTVLRINGVDMRLERGG